MKIHSMTQQEKVTYMLSEPVQQLVCRMAVPTIISMLISSFYNMADTFFVGKLNTQATAAVGVVFSVMTLIQAAGFFFGHGSGNYISRNMGAQNFEEVNKMAATGFYTAFGAGILVALLCILFLEPLAVLLGSTDTILPYAKSYLRIILLGAPFMMSSLVLNNQLRYQGSASYGMVGIVSGAVLNLVLDPVLIFALDMGVSGAALATTISQMISFLILYAMCCRGGNIRIQWKNVSLKSYYFKEMVRGGFPSLCRQGLASVSAICLNNCAGLYGGALSDAAIAAMSIVNRIYMFANSALIGFGQGFQPVCGMNYGAKQYKRVREAFHFCVKYAIFLLVAASLAGILFAKPLVTLFRKDDGQVIEIATLALQLRCAVFPLSSWMVMTNMMLQSIGKAVSASLAAAARQGLFFIPLIFILPYFFGLLGVQMCQTWADVCAFILTLPLGLHALKEMKRLEQMPPEMQQ